MKKTLLVIVHVSLALVIGLAGIFVNMRIAYNSADTHKLETMWISCIAWLLMGVLFTILIARKKHPFGLFMAWPWFYIPVSNLIGGVGDMKNYLDFIVLGSCCILGNVLTWVFSYMAHIVDKKSG